MPPDEIARFVPTAGRLAANDAWRSEAAGNDGTHPAAGGYAALAGIVLGGRLPDWIDALR